MANPVKINEDDKTFYLYDYSNILVKRTKKIYSPYNVKTLWRTPSEDYFNDPDSVEFKDWQYTVSLAKLWRLRYDQQIEWLSFYNTRWGQLSKWDSALNQKHINGRWFKNDWIHKIEMEKIHIWPKPEINTVIEKIEVQQIPENIAKMMNVKQLEELAISWNVTLPENFKETWDAEKAKDIVIMTLSEAWHIKL